MKDHALTQAIEVVGGPAELGRRLQISSQAISQWKRCPPERVLQVETATGGKVTRQALRPDLYPPSERIPVRRKAVRHEGVAA